MSIVVSEVMINESSEVVLHFDLKLEDGSAADSTRVYNKPAKLVMGDGSLTVNFERCLLGLKKGDKKSFTLPPDDAFGMPNPDNIYFLDRSKFDASSELEVGMIMGFSQNDGSELPGLIRAVEGHSVCTGIAPGGEWFFCGNVRQLDQVYASPGRSR